MQQDGLELLAIWREVGEWWCDKPPHEYRRFIDDKGIRRELEHVLEEQYSAPRGESYDETHTEEWSLRLNKLRDEKVMRACGLVPKTSHRILEPQSGSYSALHVTSGYAFGRGTMLAEEIPVVAAACEIQAVALTDPFSLVGSVEFARMARSVGIKPLIGTSVEMPEGGELVLIARSKRGYRNLSNLITQCHLGEARLFPQCTWERLREFSADLFCLTGGDQGYFNHLVYHRLLEKAANYLDELTAVFGSDCVFVEVDRSFLPWEVQTNKRLIELAIAKRVTCVASGLVTHARPGHFPVQDTIVCIHTLCKIDELLGRKQRLDNNLGRPDRALNSERFLRSSWEMSNLFADSPALLANTNT